MNIYEEEEYQNQYSFEKDATLPTGEKVRVTHYKNGKSTVHFGGPVGDVNYDEYGEED